MNFKSTLKRIRRAENAVEKLESQVKILRSENEASTLLFNELIKLTTHLSQTLMNHGLLNEESLREAGLAIKLTKVQKKEKIHEVKGGLLLVNSGT